MLLAAGITDNIENGIYTNPIGALMFEALWTGPDLRTVIACMRNAVRNR
jgi:hypothetical protein